MRQEHQLPGLTAAYLRPGEAAVAFASGSADQEQSIAATVETRMMSGSTGETFMAALALALVHEGKLDLDAPISRWLGEEPWFDRLPNARAITVRSYLNHSSGLANHVFSEAFSGAILRLTPDQQFAPRRVDCLAGPRRQAALRSRRGLLRTPTPTTSSRA